MHMRSFTTAGLAMLLPGLALAAPRDPAAAETLFRAARGAVDKGDYAAACPKFEESNRLDPEVGTVFNLADCDEHLGKVATAWQLFKEVAQRLPQGDERVAIASSRAAALEKKLPRVVLRATSPLPPGSSVLRDGVELGTASFDLPLPIDPGDHVIVVKSPGRSDWQQTLNATLGQTAELALEPGNRLPEGQTSGMGASGLPGGESEGGSHRRTTGFVLLAVGGAGIATSLITGAVALSAKHTVDESCKDKLCSPDGLDAADRGSKAATVSTVAFTVGVLGAAIGTYLLVTDKPDAKATSALKGPALGAGWVPGGGVVTVSGRIW